MIGDTTPHWNIFHMDTSTYNEFTKAHEKFNTEIREQGERDKKNLETWLKNVQKQDALPKKEREEMKALQIKVVLNDLKAKKKLWEHNEALIKNGMCVSTSCHCQ